MIAKPSPRTKPTGSGAHRCECGQVIQGEIGPIIAGQLTNQSGFAGLTGSRDKDNSRVVKRFAHRWRDGTGNEGGRRRKR